MINIKTKIINLKKLKEHSYLKILMWYNIENLQIKYGRGAQVLKKLVWSTRNLSIIFRSKTLKKFIMNLQQ